VAKGEKLPTVNPAIDLANSVSLQFMLPLGGHDLARLEGEFQVRLAHSDDIFSPRDLTEGQIETVTPGEIVYADAAEVRTRRWVWRQGRKAQVTASSYYVFFPIDGFVGLNEAKVKEAAQVLAELLTQHLGAVCQTFFVDKDNTVIEWETIKTGDGENPNNFSIVLNQKREADAIDELLTRGVADIKPGRSELEKKLRSGKQLRVKFGIDPTGPRIHIGRSVAIHKMRQFQQLGHQVVLIIGQFTAQIGDASDKNSTRPMLTREQVEANMQHYKQQISLILDENKVEWHYNTEWFDQMNFQTGIELMSRFTVAQMLERETFSERFHSGKPISLQEIIYPILQGYDSVKIKADVEIGGTDQLFNMMAGRQIQQSEGQEPQSVLMNVMINGVDGRKMSTSEGNGLYIDEAPQQQFGQMMRTVDEQIIPYFEVITDVPLVEIAAMKVQLDSGINPMNLKKRLAWTLVKMYHGKAAADEAQREWERIHQTGEIPQEIKEWSPEAGQTELDIADLLVKTGLASGKNEAKRLAGEGGIKINGEKLADPRAKISLSDGMILQRGNRHFIRIKLS
jgi:tyrosyl-tRNA synthetase